MTRIARKILVFAVAAPVVIAVYSIIAGLGAATGFWIGFKVFG